MQQRPGVDRLRRRGGHRRAVRRRWWRRRCGGGAPCDACDHYSGSLSGTGDSDYQPNGTYYYSSSGTQRGWLEGPGSADFDLYLWRWNGRRWVTVASSLSSSSSEAITYDGSAGYYVWRILSYSGSGGYDFWLDRP